MMDKTIKKTAIRLRLAGNTYGQILNKLGHISKSTLSHWLKDLELSKKSKERLRQTQNLHLLKARKIAYVRITKKRKDLLDGIKTGVVHLAKKTSDIDTLKIALAFLYLGEGSKWKSHKGLQLGNSDPLLLGLYLKLLKHCYGIDKSLLQCYISYRADQNLEDLKKFWSKRLKIPLKNFHNSKSDSRTIGKPTKNLNYKGVCIVSGGSTKVQQELEFIPQIIKTGL